MNQTNASKPNRKIRVGVLFGGRSGEHEVSLMSARSVMDALDPEKYEVVPIGITRAGEWLAVPGVDTFERLNIGALEVAGSNGDIKTLDVTLPNVSTLQRANVPTLDVVFPVLHGSLGEDGTVQGLLELANIPYVGAGVVGSAVGMDKAIFKDVMAAHGLPVLPWRLVLSRRWQEQPERVLDEIESALPYPLFTKPANLGSSVGVSKCRDRQALRAGFDEAARYDRRLIVEQGIEAHELEVAVLGNEAPIASVVGEIRPRRAFYDYVAKYISDDSELLIPAPLDEETAAATREMALRAYQAIDCAGLGRVDLLLDKQSGDLYINEINTIPGFTRISMYPKLWEATGIRYAKLLDRLIELALERHSQKEHLERAYDISGT